MARWNAVRTDEELEKLEKQAELLNGQAAAQRELNGARREMDDATNPMRELEARQDDRNNAEHERSAAARQRFADSHALTAVTDPGRYNPGVVRAARDYLENRGMGRTRYEFDEMQKTARQKSEDNARGMVGQGADAARARAAADKDIATTNASSAQKMKDAELAAQKELGAMDAATRKYGIDAEHGVRNADGTVSEGSRERIERIKGESSVEAQREAARGVAAKAEAQRMQKMDEWAARAKVQLDKDAAAYTNAQVRGMAGIIAKAYEAAVTPEDRAKISEQLKEQYKNNTLAMSLIGTMDAPETQNPNPGQGTGGQTTPNPAKNIPANPKEGDRVETTSGVAVRRNGKWVIEK